MKEIMFQTAKACGYAVFGWGLFLVLASTPLSAQPSDELYRQGANSFQNGDYLAAVKFLFAYRQLESFNLKPDFQMQIEDALNYAEGKVREAINTKEELDKHGRVTKVTVETKGKFDDPNRPQEKSVPFKAPPISNQPKPGLPFKPVLIRVGQQPSDVSVPEPTTTMSEKEAFSQRNSGRTRELEMKLAELQRIYELFGNKLEELRIENRRLRRYQKGR